MRKMNYPPESAIYLYWKRVHCLVPGDLPSTSPVLPGSVPKSSNKIAAASNSSQVKWAGQSKDGERVTIPLVLSTEPFW